MKSKNIYLYVTFIIFVLIAFLAPISGDDFGNYISTDGTILSAIKLALSYYQKFEGRVVGRIIIMFTTYHKVIWNILTPCMFAVLIASSFKLLNKTSSCIIFLLGLLLVNHDMFSQTYTWIAGSITYLYPTCLSLFYFITIYFKHNNYKMFDYIILIILCIITPLFVENIGCAFVLGNIILLLYNSIREKKLNILYFITTLISGGVLLFMLMSPGSAARSLTENVDFNNLSIISKFLVNIKNFNNYVFFKNSTMIIITIIPILYYLIKNKHKIFAILISVIPVISVISNIYYMLPMKFEFLQKLTLTSIDNTVFILYWIIYLIVFILSINYIVKNKKEKTFIYFMLILGLSSSGAMLIVPTWGDRVTLYATVIFTLVGTVLIDKIIKNDIFLLKLLKLFFATTCCYLLICFFGIYQINNYRETYIKEQLKEDKAVIEVIRNPIVYLWNNNPQSDYFINTYKSYMNIDKEKNIVITKLGYLEYLNLVVGGKR